MVTGSATRIMLVAGICTVALSSPAQDPNLAVNGSFDSNVDGWSLHTSSCALFVWDPMDAAMDSNSGSASLEERCGPPPIAQVEAGIMSNCVDTADIDEFIVSGAVFHEGDPWTDRVILDLLVYSDPVCSASETAIPVGEVAGSASWVTLSGLVDLTQGIGFQVAGARIRFRQRVACCKFSFLDNARLIPVEVFSDGFELGDATGWSNTIP